MRANEDWIFQLLLAILFLAYRRFTRQHRLIKYHERVTVSGSD